MTPEYLNDLHYIWPEVVMTVAILLALFSDLILGGKDQKVTGTISVLCTCLVIYFLARLWMEDTTQQPFGIMVVDGFALFFKLMTAVGLLIVLIFSICYREFDRDGIGEYYAVILSAALGIFFLVSTDNMVLLYLALEMLSITSYALAGFLKKDRRSSEAALKYLVYGALSSGVMVFGFSIFYGLAGDMQLGVIGRYVGENFSTYSTTILVASMMVLMGFCYKIAAFPFHFWCPDVYEGAPTPVTTFLAVCSKAAGFGLMLRFFYMVFGSEASYAADWGPKFAILIGILSAVTMTYGNITAMKQNNVKRLLAYSSIAHAGYLLMGVAAMLTTAEGTPSTLGSEAVIFYLLTYLIMNLGAFGFAIYISNQYGKNDLDEYTGLGWKSPYAAAFMVVFLLSLTGIPPTIGFVGKFKLFWAAIDAGMYWLVICAALNSVISLFYYFRFAKALFLKNVPEGGESETALPAQGMMTLTLAVLGIATVYFGVFFGVIEKWAGLACP